MYEISRYSLELGLLQIVTFPTRQRNILDIFITNRPTLVRSCTSIPGISDHEAVCVLSNIIAKVHKSIPRKIVLWNKANFTLIEEIIIDFNNKFQLSYDPSTPVSTLWDKFNDFANCLNENKQIDTMFLTFLKHLIKYPTKDYLTNYLIMELKVLRWHGYKTTLLIDTKE